MVGVVVTISVLGAAARGPVESAAVPSQTGASEAAAFCARWEEARSALLDEDVGFADERGEGHRIHEIMIEQVQLIDAIEPTVPDEIRDVWDVAAGFRRGATDLLFTVNFQPAFIRPVHLELAYGHTDAERAGADALAAVYAIDEWTVTGCGDFCTRWPEIEGAVRVSEEALGGGPAPVMIALQEERDVRLLELVDPLVPDEVRPAWEFSRELRALKTATVEAYPDRPWELDRYFMENRINFNGLEYIEELDRRLEPVASWVEANCEGIDVGGRARGRLHVEVRTPASLIGSSLLVAIVEPGTPVTGLQSNEAVLATECWDVGGGEDRHLFATLGAPGPSPGLCEPTPEPVVFEGGTYDVVVLGVVGLGSGDVSSYVPAPDWCTRFTAVVDGNTTVEAPPLVPCSLGPIAGDPADVADRHAPVVELSEPGAGTVTLVVPDAVSPVREPDADPAADHAGGSMLAIVLPEGTTLDQVGRHEVWPSGIVCMRVFTPEFVVALEDSHDRERLTGPFPLPVTVLPQTGHHPACYFPFDLRDTLAGGGGLEPVVLATGTYDLHLEVSIAIDGLVGAEQHRCLSQQIAVDGDVTVDVPPPTDWGECP